MNTVTTAKYRVDVVLKCGRDGVNAKIDATRVEVTGPTAVLTVEQRRMLSAAILDSFGLGDVGRELTDVGAT
jgi:hypothetical protein